MNKVNNLQTFSLQLCYLCCGRTLFYRMEWSPFASLCDDEGVETRTTRDQKDTEDAILDAPMCDLQVLRNMHRDFLLGAISAPPPAFHKYTSQEPWLPYWFSNSISILGFERLRNLQVMKNMCAQYEFKRIGADGGFAPTPYEMSHAVLTYASINAIALSMDRDVYSGIDRERIYKWFMTLKQPNGSFASAKDYECDARSTYCVISVASLLNMLTDELVDGTVDFLVSCQGPDGGFAPFLGSETHGGYGFCALAALDLLGAMDRINAHEAVCWCAMRQMEFGGGFSGRTNKLVDTCYTWWIGAMCKILSDYLNIPPFWNEEAICNYVLTLCQDQKKGGLKDKPGVRADMYHTMYGLAGLSVTCRDYIFEKTNLKLEEVDARYGITAKSAECIKSFFQQNPYNPQ